METFPAGQDESRDERNIANNIFGNRFLSDQTLYEYLIEFLLVFSADKEYQGEHFSGSMKFHENLNQPLQYYLEPRMGLRRFIFFDKAKREGSIAADAYVYNKLIEYLKDRIVDVDEEKKAAIVDDLQDLLHGYAVIVKKRAWCAQAMLPVCKELIFCGAMPNEKERRNKTHWTATDYSLVDQYFDFTKRNFLARGGEVYYLHLLQGLQKKPENKIVLERLLNDLITGHSSSLSNIAKFIQTSWENLIGLSEKEQVKSLKVGYIPATGYVGCANFSIEELINFLSTEMQAIKKIELLSKGMMLQIMRMMNYRVADYLDVDRKPWIIDMGSSDNDIVKKVAVASFNSVEESFITALNNKGSELLNKGIIEQKDFIKSLQLGRKNSWDIFKAKGKEIQCVIPMKGANERFTLSEDIIRFLVLALLEPGEKVTLNMFLNKLYKRYDIVIGPVEYKESVKNDPRFEASLASSFEKNIAAFQEFLKATGFLRELSDATSIVVNPYTKLTLRDVAL